MKDEGTVKTSASSSMLRQNSELKPHRIWNFSIPAWFVDMPDGTRFKTCPNAGACAQVCYARNGTYRFPGVLAAHTRNLQRYLDDRQQFIDDMITELRTRKFRPSGVPRTDLPVDNDEWMAQWAQGGGAAVRMHDAGDFFSRQYLDDWMTIAEWVPDVLFYAYTKEVSMTKARLAERGLPDNVRILFSTGGLEDHLIDPDVDRHADVFPDLEHIEDAGYQSQDASDLLAVTLPTTRIGIPANNIPQFNRKMNGRRFSELGRASFHKETQP